MKKTIAILIGIIIIVTISYLLFFLNTKQDSGNTNKIIELVGSYVEGKYARTKYWGYDCYIVENSGKKHIVNCLEPESFGKEMINKTLKIKGEVIPPQKVPDDYVGQKAGDYWPGYTKILNYEIIE